MDISKITEFRLNLAFAPAPYVLLYMESYGILWNLVESYGIL